MTKSVIIAIEKMADDKLLQKRETVVGIRIVKERYSEEDIQQLLTTISKELKPFLIEYLHSN